MQKLRALREHPNSCRVQYVAKRKCFVRTRTSVEVAAQMAAGKHAPPPTERCRGLTRVLERAFPVAEHDTCPRCDPEARASARKQSERKRTLLGYVASDLQPMGKKKRKHFVAVSSGGSSGNTNNTNNTNMCRRTISNMAHGSGVDLDVEKYVRAGKFTPSADICSVSLMVYLKTTLGWQPIATQVPIYSPSLGIATAIDLLCTDVETHTKLFLVEVKATRARGTAASVAACYTTSANTAVGNLRGLPMSRYSSHQLQLWAMAYTLRAECAVTLDGAAVLRTSPARVYHYPLSPWFDGRERALVKRLAAVAARKNGSYKDK